MKWSLKLLQLLLKYGFPGYIILVPIVATYGHLMPWQTADQVLNKFDDQTPLMVGFKFRETRTQSGSTSYISRSYILIPSVFSEPKTITISQTNSDTPVVVKSPYGFLLLLGWIMVCFFGSWWFWLRPKQQARAQ